MNVKEEEVLGSAWETSHLPKAEQKGKQANKRQAWKTPQDGSEARLSHLRRHPSELQIPTLSLPAVTSKCVHLGDCGDGSVDKDNLTVDPHNMFKKQKQKPPRLSSMSLFLHHESWC